MVYARRLLFAGMVAAATPAATQTRFPFTDAIRTGDLLFLSGQIGAAPGASAPVAGGVAAQTRQAMENIGAVLKQHDLGYRDLVKCTIMLTDIAQWSELNRVYSTFFVDGRYPARSTIGAAALALGAKVEIDCIARFPARRIAVNVTTPLGPYSQTVRSGGVVYISGIIAYDPRSRSFAAPNIEAQMKLMFANLDEQLAAANLTRDDIVKTTLLLRNAADMPAANQAYAAYFARDPKPARTTIPGPNWGRADILVELEAIAAAPPSEEH